MTETLKSLGSKLPGGEPSRPRTFGWRELSGGGLEGLRSHISPWEGPLSSRPLGPPLPGWQGSGRLEAVGTTSPRLPVAALAAHRPPGPWLLEPRPPVGLSKEESQAALAQDLLQFACSASWSMSAALWRKEKAWDSLPSRRAEGRPGPGLTLSPQTHQLPRGKWRPGRGWVS